MKLQATPSQTVGPFFRIGLRHLRREQVIPPRDGDAEVKVRGRVIDGNGEPIHDVAIEIWQAGTDGVYDHVGARGFGRVFPDDAGEFTFTTVRPGPVPGPEDTTQAPHLVVVLFMRGLLKQLFTRMYFPDEPRNETDPVLMLVPAERRSTVIAREADGVGRLTWNIVLQGDGETVFFEC